MTATRPRSYRFALTLALLFAAQVAVLAAFLLFLSLDAAPSQRAVLGQLLAQNVPMLALLALLLLLALGFGQKFFIDAYLGPLDRLAEETVLLAANPRHRLPPLGGPGVRALVGKLNDLAAAHQTLHEQGRAGVEQANRSLSEERNRLAALMSDLALSVLVCNIDGGILLYNQRARQLLHAGEGALGLGRSVFGVIGRDPLEHALDQVRHQMAAGAHDPVAAFVTALADGAVVRVQMAPVLDSERALGGFVLTLDDITRRAEAESRRDHVLQSLSIETRAALANVRAAVETMQAFPSMEADMHARLAGVIDAESQRLVLEIDSVEQLCADARDAHWELEHLRGAELLALLQRRIDSASLRVIPGDAVDTSLWLNADSYALALALGHMARRLASEAGVHELHLGLQRSGRLAFITLSWDDAPLPADTLRGWENEVPASPGAGVARTLKDVVARHGGETVYRSGAARQSSYALLLPVAEARIALAVPQGGTGDAHFYDFDLFHQPGQTAALDQRPLSQLAYTVFDTETTGLQPTEGDEIISIGAVRIVNGRLLRQECFDRLVQPVRAPSAESMAIHGIGVAMLEGQPRIGQVLAEFERFARDTVLVAHNAAFDMRFLQVQQAATSVAFDQPVLDTLLLSQVIHPNQPLHTLEAICARLCIEVSGRHTALGDAVVTGQVFLAMLPLLAEKGIDTLKQAREASQQTLYARIQY